MLKCVYVFNDGHVLVDGSECIGGLMGGVDREGRRFETFCRFGPVMLWRESLSAFEDGTTRNGVVACLPPPEAPE